MNRFAILRPVLKAAAVAVSPNESAESGSVKS